MSVAVINYGVGNIGSLLNVLKRLGIPAVATADPAEIERAERLILPGVGAFDYAMKHLNDSGLIPVLNQKVLTEKTPILGICLGMQILAEGSEEGAPVPGLGWIKGRVKRFDMPDAYKKRLKIPHMGWNDITPQKGLFTGLDPESRFYFVHSYHMCCDDPADVGATTTYGYSFTSAVQRENIIGMQFHPEKSHHYGWELIERFLNV